MCANVNHLLSSIAQVGGQPLFQFESGMIGTERDTHGLARFLHRL
jgi:hypothetical protein